MPPTPRIVELSISLYRLLLAAYPPAFRQEYGDAMVQLFRDSALDCYRQGGLGELAAMWAQTIADFTVSVVRQHRDNPVAANNEMILLRDLLRQWGQVGRAALAVSALSVLVTLQLLQMFCRRTLVVGQLLTAVAIGLWGWSFFDHVGTRFGHQGTSFYVTRGSIEIHHLYEVGEPVSWEQWRSHCRALLEKEPDLDARIDSITSPWEFSFVPEIPAATDLQYGRDRVPTIVKPFKAYRLRFPFAFVPMLFSVWPIRVFQRRNISAVAAMQSV